MTSLSQTINHIVEKEIESLITRISVDYKIDLEDIKKRYELMFISSLPVAESPTVEEPCETPLEAPKKQRGRKKKVKDEFIETKEYTYNGVTYLVDQKNNVYTYNVESPSLIGEKLVDGTVKFNNGYINRSH